MKSAEPLPSEAIQIRALACERGGRTLFGPLDICVPAATALFVLGPNGCGKSTLLRAVAGLSEPVSGDVLWGAQRMRFATAQWRQGLAYVGHKLGHKDELSVEENLALAMALEGSNATYASFTHALERVGLLRQRGLIVRRLSQGQKQRLALARLCLSERSLWLLDEPSAALDTGGKLVLTSMLSDHLSQGGAALIATHDLIEVAAERSASLKLA